MIQEVRRNFVRLRRDVATAHAKWPKKIRNAMISEDRILWHVVC